jgi:hypothetical protein
MLTWPEAIVIFFCMLAACCTFFTLLALFMQLWHIAKYLFREWRMRHSRPYIRPIYWPSGWLWS